jgi:sulfoxide reductase heme-binding subunit YedZ
MEASRNDNLWFAIMTVFLGAVLLALFALVALIPGSPVPRLVAQWSDRLFAFSSVQALWYVTRAAGIIAYLLLWLATVWGLAVSSKVFDPVLQRFFTYDMHQFLSLLAIGFSVLHVVVLLADRYLPFSVAQVLVPFIAPYRPLWVGFGVIGLYLVLLVSATFYIRQRIGYATFHVIHYLSLLAYAGITVHGLMAGTDSPLWTTLLMYGGTALVVVFLFVYRLVMALLGVGSTTRQSIS